MRRLLVLVACLAALSGCTSGHDAVDQAAGANGYVAGDGRTLVFTEKDRRPAPAVQGSTVDGGTFDLASVRGHVVVVNFWASWCAPCRLEAAELEAAYLSTKDSGVDFLGVDSRDERDPAKAFVADKGLTYPSLFDPAGRIALRFTDVPPTALPATLVVDRQGRVAAVIRAGVTRDGLTALVKQIAGT